MRIRDRSPDPSRQFEALYEATSRQVYAYARRRADPETAECIVSDTFLAAWRHSGEIPDPPLPWLLRTAHNALRTHRRSTRRRERLAQSVIFDTTLATLPSAEAQALGRQQTLAALRRLGEDDREMLLLIAWDGLDYGQAAEVLGISRSAFATRLSRARRRLDALLSDDDPHPDPTRQEITA